MEFSNNQINISSLPSVEEIDFQGLERNYLTVEILGATIFWIFPLIGYTVFRTINELDLSSWIENGILVLLLLIIASSYVLLYKGFRKKLFALREKDIVYSRGLIWRKLTLLPFNRIQHAEVEQGPIERIFELGQLKLYTAGGSSSDLTISGLKFDNAQAIKSYVLKKTSVDEEE